MVEVMGFLKEARSATISCHYHDDSRNTNRPRIPVVRCSSTGGNTIYGTAETNEDEN